MPAPTTLNWVDIDELRESPFNPRRNYGNLTDLAATMKDGGIRQPPLARPTKDGLELVFGHRRLRAAKIAGLKKIQVQVREMDDVEVMKEQLIENAQREDIHPMDEAEAFGQLRDAYGQKKKGERFVEDLARSIGKSRAHVFGRLKLLDLAEPVRERFRKNAKLSADGMLEVVRLENERLQLRALERYESGGPGGDALSVRALRLWIRDAFKESKPSRAGAGAGIDRDARERLERTAAAAVTKMVTMLERERAFEHHQVRAMALALVERGVDDSTLRRRGVASAESLRRAVDKMTPPEVRGLLFELATSNWVRIDGDDFSSDFKALAKSMGINLREIEEAEELFKNR